MSDSKLVLWVEKWPDWLRWLLFVPITLVIALVGAVIVSYIYRIFFDYSEGFARLTGSAIASVTIMYITPVMVPKGKLPTTIAFGCVWGVLHLFNLITGVLTLFRTPQYLDWWAMAAGVISIIIIVASSVSQTREHFASVNGAVKQ
jgi:hypothetical protein